MIRRRQATLIVLTITLVALTFTARCEAPGASAASERGQAPPQSSEAVSAAQACLPTPSECASRPPATRALPSGSARVPAWLTGSAAGALLATVLCLRASRGAATAVARLQRRVAAAIVTAPNGYGRRRQDCDKF